MADVKKQEALSNELASKLWECANNLRGNMDAQEFKNYILGLIFYRYLSNKVEKHFEKELAEDKITYEEAFNDPEYIEAIKEDSLESLGYIIEPKYLFSNVIKMIELGKFSIDYLTEIINSITMSTEGQPSEEAFTSLFEDMDLNSSKLGKEVKQRTKIISSLLNTIDDINFEFEEAHFDILGTAYMNLIGLFASSAGKKGGEFYTPANMSKLVARLATVGLKDSLSAFDCACGSGSLLLEVGKYCNVRNYYGQELNSSTYNLARMNMLLHGIAYNNFKIVNCDTLLDDTHFEDKKFTIQVANPPYSLEWNPPANLIEDERFSIYGKLAPKDKADFSFLQTMIHHMDSDGRIAVLLPHGILYRGGAEETIRKYIVKNLNYLDAVIGLPPNCFNGTSIPVCCLVLKKDRKENSDNICFIDSSRYFTEGKNKNFITDEDIDRIVNAYVERKDIDKFCYIAKIEEIIENDCNLNIPRYVDVFDKDVKINIFENMKNISNAQDEVKCAISRLNGYLSELKISQ